MWTRLPAASTHGGQRRERPRIFEDRSLRRFPPYPLASAARSTSTV